MKILRHLTSLVMVMTLLLTLTGPALAATYDLTLGDITVTADASGQTVTQNTTTTADNDVTITSGGVATGNTVTLSSAAGAVASVTIENLVIGATEKNGIDVTDGSNAQITVSGSNSVTTLSDDYDWEAPDYAAIHVADGNLTITGDSDDDELYASTPQNQDQWSGGYGAAIGSNENEDLDGTITITGNVDVFAYAGDEGAGIGSGEEGDFNGTINISSGANVNALSENDGAGIGSGDNGDFNGTVNINGATVDAESDDEGTGIGTGENGTFSKTGVVNIINSTVKADSDEDLAAIGAENGFYGQVNIVNSTVTARADEGAPAIGGGDDGPFAGTVNVQDSDLILSLGGNSDAAGIGEGEGNAFTGTINLTGNTSVHVKNNGDATILLGAVDGAPDGIVNIGDNVKIYNDRIDPNKPLTGDDLRNAVGGRLNPTSPDNFWWNVYKQVKAAAKGDKITVDAGWRTYIPVYVMEAVAEMGVTLTISWERGADVTIDANTEIPNTSRAVNLADLAG